MITADAASPKAGEGMQHAASPALSLSRRRAAAERKIRMCRGSGRRDGDKSAHDVAERRYNECRECEAQSRNLSLNMPMVLAAAMRSSAALLYRLSVIRSLRDSDSLETLFAAASLVVAGLLRV